MLCTICDVIVYKTYPHHYKIPACMYTGWSVVVIRSLHQIPLKCTENDIIDILINITITLHVNVHAHGINIASPHSMTFNGSADQAHPWLQGSRTTF